MKIVGTFVSNLVSISNVLTKNNEGKMNEVPLYRTDVDGTIIIKTNGDTLSISLEKERD